MRPEVVLVVCTCACRLHRDVAGLVGVDSDLFVLHL